MHNKFHFSLSLATFILTTAIILFGGVYLVSIENKYGTILRSPQIESEEVDKELVDSKRKISILEAQVRALQDNLIEMSKSSTVTEAQAAAVIDSPSKVDIFADDKCFQDVDHLDQCVIIADTKIKDDLHVMVKPASPISAGTNKIVLEFYQGDRKTADYTFDTDNLLKTAQPIATVVYASSRDITLQIKTAPGDKNTILNFDGDGWIEYKKTISQISQGQ